MPDSIKPGTPLPEQLLVRPFIAEEGDVEIKIVQKKGTVLCGLFAGTTQENGLFKSECVADFIEKPMAEELRRRYNALPSLEARVKLLENKLEDLVQAVVDNDLEGMVLGVDAARAALNEKKGA